MNYKVTVISKLTADACCIHLCYQSE